MITNLRVKLKFLFIPITLFLILLIIILKKPSPFSNVILENIQIDGNKYSYEFGKVKNENGQPVSKNQEDKVKKITAFYIWTIEDPLFTSPGFDTEKYKESIKLLRDKAKEYSLVSGRKDKLVPVEFLESIPSIFESEKAFLASPSGENASKLVESYKVAGQAYKNESSEFFEKEKSQKDLIGGLNFVFINTYTTTNILFSDLEKIKLNGVALEDEVAARKKCLENLKVCKRPSLNWKKPDFKISPKEFKLLPLSILFYFYTEERGDITKGLYAVHSPCWGWSQDYSEPLEPFYLLYGPKKLTKEVLVPKLATTNYYKYISPDTDFAPSRRAREMGLTRLWQLETNNYLCSNLEYLPKLATLDYFWHNFKNKPLLMTNPHSRNPNLVINWQKAQNLEKKFFNLSIPDEDSLNELGQTYRFLYRYWPKEDILVKKDLLERSLIIEKRLVDFDKVLNKSIIHIDQFTKRERSDLSSAKSDKYFYSYVYLIRNPWQLTYFPFSSSFWRLKENLTYLEKGSVKTEDEEKPYINYEEALQKFSPEQIKKMHDATKDVYLDDISI